MLKKKIKKIILNTYHPIVINSYGKNVKYIIMKSCNINL